MQNNRWLQALIILLVIIASAWLAGMVWEFLKQFSNIFLLFFLSWLLAFILRPVARWLASRGMPYGLAVGVVYLALGLVFGLGGLLLVPVITQQIEELSRNFNTYVNQIGFLVTRLETSLHEWGIREFDATQFYSDVARQLQDFAPQALQNTLGVLQSVATVMFQLLLVFILSFYFMKDGERISSGFLQLLPPRWQDEVRLVALSIEKSFGGFIRGQLVFALIYGLLTAVVMLMPPFQLDFVVIASIVAGLCMLIPLIGNFLAFAPPMLVLLITPGKTSLWPWLLLALFIMQSIMMNFLGPRIMSSAIGIHPLYVMGAMLIGAQIAGFWGALFGIPIAGALNLIGRPLMRRLRHQTPLYRESATPALTTRSFVTGPLAAAMVERGSAQRAPAAPALDVAGQPSELVSQMYVDLDADEPPQPTISARLWRLLMMGGARARQWASTRLQARSSRQP